jgi:hypothetical protein
MNFQIRSLALGIILLIGLCAAARALPDAPRRASQPLRIAGNRDVTSLPGLDLEVTLGHEAASGNRRVQFSLDPSEARLYPSPLEDHHHLKLAGMENHGEPGDPLLPVKTIVLTLPKGAVLTSARVISGRVAPVLDRFTPVPAPEPAFWGIDVSSSPRYEKRDASYGSDVYFPGHFLSMDTGADRENTFAFLRVHPLQWNPATGEACLLLRAEIEVRFAQSPLIAPGASPDRIDDECVILAPELLQSQAEALAAFHLDRDGMESEVITLEWIDANYTEAEDPPVGGYAQFQPSYIVGYDYSLARKIVSYLRDDGAHPNLEYVTILGDAGLVPPSYYVNFGSDWHSWPPTDLFYASPDYDYYSDYHVGRIPVSDSSELTVILDKFEVWSDSLDPDWFSNLALTGGNPFDSYEYFGELICVDPVNRGYLEGHEVDKYFVTDARFSSSHVLPLFSEGGFGFVHQILHGSGGSIWFDDHTSINGFYLTGLPARSHPPVVTCIACECGAYDRDLVPQMSFLISFGEGVTKSPAGGIAYIGGSRSNAGTPIYYLDEGNLVIDREEYMADLLTRVYHSYHLGASTLGELYSMSVDSFVAYNSMGSYLNRWTLFCSVLLGDPALGLPQQSSGNAYTTPFLSGQDPDYYNAPGFPVFHVQDSMRITAETSSPSCALKIVRAEDLGPTIHRDSLPSAPLDFYYEPENGSHFSLARALAEDGREGWRYFVSGTGEIVVDGSKTDWETACIDPLAVDPADFTPLTWDVQELYASFDETFFYFGFDAFCGTQGVAYGLAIDCRPGGYSGEQGVDADALDNWITFSDEHGVDFELYYVDSVGVIYEWEDGWPNPWTYTSLHDVGGAYSFWVDQTQFVEFALPMSELGNPDEIAITVFSTGEGRFQGGGTGLCQPAQDASPRDSATYHTLHLGQGNANTISEFAKLTVSVEEDGSADGMTPPMTLRGAPNPFRGEVEIQFSLPQGSERATLRLYDASGRLVRTLFQGSVPDPRAHVLTWDGRDSRGRLCPAAVYHGILEVDGSRKRTTFLRIK